jgi:hypothetical protein
MIRISRMKRWYGSEGLKEDDTDQQDEKGSLLSGSAR